MSQNTDNSTEFKTRYPDSLKPDVNVAVKFLTDFAGGGPITVVMIPAEGPGARGRTFNTSDRKAVDEMRSFIAAYESQPYNVFWMPNRAADNIGHDVPSNDDITEIRGVVLDFDPDKGKLLEDERLRLRETVFYMADLAQPWAVVDTGGGMQMVFKLTRAVGMPIDEFGARADEHEAFLKRLARALGADTRTCKLKNLFRVPGTVNWPNAAKKAAGREKSVSGVWLQGGPSTTLETLGRLCAVRPDDVLPDDKLSDVDLGDLTEAELIHVLGKPKHLPVAIATLINSSPTLVTAIKRVGANPGDTSKDDHILCCALVRFGIAPADVALILAAYGAKVATVFKQHRLFSYVRGTVARAVHDVGMDALEGFATFAEAEAAKKAHLEKIRCKTIDELTAGIYDAQALGVVQGLLGEQQTSMVYGASGSGKTFVVLDIAYHVALGKEWNGRKVAHGVIVYVAAESPMSVAYRVDALRQVHGDAPNFMTVTEVVDMYTGTHDFQKLNEALDALPAPPKLIVFDTLARANSGDENSAKDMSQLIKHGDRLRDKYKANVLWVHHSGKDESKKARGSSALRAATDTEIEIQDASMFKLTKLRDGDLGSADYSFKLKERSIGRLPDGVEVTSCIVEWSSTPVATDPMDKRREQIVKVLALLGEPSTAREILREGKAQGLFPAKFSQQQVRIPILRAIERGYDFTEHRSDDKKADIRYGLLRWGDNSVI